MSIPLSSPLGGISIHMISYIFHIYNYLFILLVSESLVYIYVLFFRQLIDLKMSTQRDLMTMSSDLTQNGKKMTSGNCLVYINLFYL